jgi:hypothetical protein
MLLGENSKMLLLISLQKSLKIVNLLQIEIAKEAQITKMTRKISLIKKTKTRLMMMHLEQEPLVRQ